MLDRHLATSQFMVGDEYTIADMAIWPWYGATVMGWQYNAAEFLDVASYTHVRRWAEQIWARPEVKRGRMVNRFYGPETAQVHERHSASDFDGKFWP